MQKNVCNRLARISIAIFKNTKLIGLKSHYSTGLGTLGISVKDVALSSWFKWPLQWDFVGILWKSFWRQPPSNFNDKEVETVGMRCFCHQHVLPKPIDFIHLKLFSKLCLLLKKDRRWEHTIQCRPRKDFSFVHFRKKTWLPPLLLPKASWWIYDLFLIDPPYIRRSVEESVVLSLYISHYALDSVSTELLPCIFNTHLVLCQLDLAIYFYPIPGLHLFH